MYSRAQLLANATRELTAAGVESAANDARVILRELQAAEYRSRDLVPPVIPEPEIDAALAQRYREAIKRRCAREPLQLIVGHVFFHSIEIAVAPNVFIPRPETEWLVELAIKHLRTRLNPANSPAQESGINPPTAPSRDEKPLVIVDLCAGTGAIGLALANAFPSAEVIAVEIDPTAHALANRNASALDLANYRCHLADARAADISALLPQSAQLVVTNPPYLIDPVTQPEAMRDPELALYGQGQLGLDIPLQILHTAAEILAPGGELLLEHDPRQAQPLRTAARTEGLVNVHTENDLTATPRFLCALRNSD